MEFFNSLTSHFHAFVLSLALFIQVLTGAITSHPSVVITPPPLSPSQHSSVVSTSLNASGCVGRTSPCEVLAPTSTVSKSTATTPTKSLPKTTTVLTSKNITQVAVPAAPTITSPAPISLLPTEQLNTQTRASLVNILCTTKAGGSFEPISGSGVIVDTRGVILTNAHVGQFFLLTNYGSPGNIQCVVRTGSPASPSYTATLLYLPPPWVEANASQIISQEAMGTGENDYSFLLITGTVSSNIPYPVAFPALPMSSNAPDVDTDVFLAAYPAQLLGGQTIQENLYASSAMSTVQTLYTFNDPANVDLVSLAGTVVAQSGSSGGAVIDATNGKLVGLITTETQGTTTASRNLNAITLAHINRSLTSLGEGGIIGLLSGDLQQKSADFAANTAPAETQQLEAVLNKTSY